MTTHRKPTPFSRLLVANRGEIALRVMRSARGLGLGTVAVYSAADEGARHVREADAAVFIGEAQPRKSYLDIAKIIDAARASGADAIHPGYGFLSENAAFAQACAEAGIVFVGPSSEAIRRMGDKAAAKAAMEEAGVPCIPGYSGDDQSDERLAAEAGRIGWPVMIKAVAGGGGRGMRRVDDPSDFASHLKSARSEAQGAFGDGRVMLEKAIVRPRHVEVQVFGDRYGNAIHLGERDCSVQRRHQKLVEEAPSPAVSPELRRRMGEAATAAVRAIGYEGAGTLEFLLDAEGSFHFMEMNTRLQVEHPVTEEITGIDLVALQLRVAAGEPLPFSQEDVAFSGHAIEVRLCAEDPARNFLPQSGRIALWKAPQAVRVEAALESGATVSPYYDSMVAKLIAHGATREEARRRLIDALERTALHGIATNREVLARILDHPVFADGGATTAFLADHGDEVLAPGTANTAGVLAIGAALLRLSHGGGAPALSPLTHSFPAPMRLTLDGALRSCEIVVGRDGTMRLSSGDTVVELRIDMLSADEVRFTAAGRSQRAVYTLDGTALRLTMNGRDHEVRDLTYEPEAGPEAGQADGLLKASMTGQVIAVHVSSGDEAKPNQPLVTLEAMKMEHAHALKTGGRVAEIMVRPGDQVNLGQVLLRLEA